MTLSRREWLASMLGAPLAATLCASGCDRAPSRIAARAMEGSLLGPSMSAGHRLREHAFTSPTELAHGDVRPVHDVLVLGGGPAGLATAWALLRENVHDFRVLELESEVGGTSASGRNNLTPYPWGAHYVPVPFRENADLIALFREMGVITGLDEQGEPIVREEVLVREPDERVFYRGFWYPGLYPLAGASAQDRNELERFKSIVGGYAAMRDARGRRAFSIPVDESSDDAQLTGLDRESAAHWLERNGFRSARLRWLCEYATRDDFGMTLETTSAWALVHYYAARMRDASSESQDLMTWPEGNGAIVKHLSRALGPRVETELLVADVSEREGLVQVSCVDTRTNRNVIHRARRVVVAMPHFIAKRVVAPLREESSASDAFTYGAWMVANLHLRDRPRSRGFSFAWDNVIYDSPSLGYVSATHQRGRELGPTVWTYYLPIADANAAAGRQRLLSHDLHDWQDATLADLRRAHFDLDDHVSRIDVWRWGHGMIQPRVGALFDGARRNAQLPRGAIHFAHSDLSGIALFENAFQQGVRAAREVATALRASA